MSDPNQSRKLKLTKSTLAVATTGLGINWVANAVLLAYYDDPAKVVSIVANIGVTTEVWWGIVGVVLAIYGAGNVGEHYTRKGE